MGGDGGVKLATSGPLAEPNAVSRFPDLRASGGLTIFVDTRNLDKQPFRRKDCIVNWCDAYE